QAFTGSGGWPTSIFMTADQKPFFAGTYFPKTTRGGMIGFKELLIAIHEAWENNKASLLKQADAVLSHLKQTPHTDDTQESDLIHSATSLYRQLYDQQNGGFGDAPKFPTPHNIMFLLSYYQRYQEAETLKMAEHTLTQMFRGGMFDHIGFGFCRYSTDEKFLVPHFEKMLYDNALLILAYCQAYRVTKNKMYLEIAEKTADYILREMTSSEGGFFSAQDADSEGEEGKYYLFTPGEIIQVLGQEQGEEFNKHFDITRSGNFEGKSIPNLLNIDPSDHSFDSFFSQLLPYRKSRFALHLDDKILTAWNALMIAALCRLYHASQKELYLHAAQKADSFIGKYLWENNKLFVSFREAKRGVEGFLDDYASYIFAQLSLYQVTLDGQYLNRAKQLCHRVESDFKDDKGGFYLYSHTGEQLVLRPKETYDGAIPSGNSLMAYNLIRLSLITCEETYKSMAERQLEFMVSVASSHPHNHAMFLLALLEYNQPPTKLTVVPDESTDLKTVPLAVTPDAVITVLPSPTKNYPQKNSKTTYYVCHGHSCKPATNNLNEIERQCEY
ncbi:MAG: thioredoxin domain-containing protein, partial [Clostridia bacterium]|nr:thioredoxin domain-containing protein [Clostridia bacterium]